MGCCGDIAHGVAGLAKAGLQMLGVPIDAVGDAELLRRREACRGCEHATRNESRIGLPTKGLTSLSMCKLCNCNIAAKTRLASEHCPLEPPKW